jgi:hypothetical protein
MVGNTYTTVYIENIAASGVAIPDLGIPNLPPGVAFDISGQFTDYEIRSSNDFRNLVENNYLTVSGTGPELATKGIGAGEFVIVPKTAVLLWLAGVDFSGQNIFIKPDPTSNGVDVVNLWDNVKRITTSGTEAPVTMSGTLGTGITFAGLGGVDIRGDFASSAVTVSGGEDFGIVRDKDGNLYAPDPTRSGVVISIYRDTWTYGRSGQQKLSYLGVHGVNNANAGYVTHRHGMITSISSHHETGTMDLHVTESGLFNQTIAEFNGLAAGDNILEPLSIEVPGNELLQLYLSNTGNVKDPVVAVEIAWRL